jgi:nucleoid-associated protein YgaU
MFGRRVDFERSFDTLGRMGRTRVRNRRRRLAVVAVISLAGGLWAAPFAHARHAGEPRPVAAHRVVVRPGDTVWTLAVRASGGADPRPLVDAIIKANDVDPGSIAPGQVLVVPSL